MRRADVCLDLRHLGIQRLDIGLRRQGLPRQCERPHLQVESTSGSFFRGSHILSGDLALQFGVAARREDNPPTTG